MLHHFYSKLQSDVLREAISQITNDSREKKRNFTETIELQIGLKNYDPQKDKRFSGSVKLPHIPRPKMKVCMLGDAQHVEEVKYVDACMHRFIELLSSYISLFIGNHFKVALPHVTFDSCISLQLYQLCSVAKLLEAKWTTSLDCKHRLIHKGQKNLAVPIPSWMAIVSPRREGLRQLVRHLL